MCVCVYVYTYLCVCVCVRVCVCACLCSKHNSHLRKECCKCSTDAQAQPCRKAIENQLRLVLSSPTSLNAAYFDLV